MKRFVLISGCSGGGKSALLDELRCRGFACVEEPGRRIIAEERESGGRALPWIDLTAFAERAIAMALADRAAAESFAGPVFFDRGLIDAAAALEHASGRAILRHFAKECYDDRVFIAPPWPQIYASDGDRQHGLEQAVAEYARLLTAFSALGYEMELLPKISVAARADFVLDRVL